MSATRISAAQRRRVMEAFRFRCAYCHTPQRIIGPLLELDHIIPESQGGASDDDNLCSACPMCNGHKADRGEAVDPQSGAVVRLFHPWLERWGDHFEWTEDGAGIRGKTPTGRATTDALDMNNPDMVSARRLWAIAGWHPPAD